MLTAKQLGTKIGGIRKSSEAIRKNVHEVLCNAAGYAFQDGDVTYFTRLIDATTGVNQKRIQRWITTNGLASWSAKKNQYVVNKAARKEAQAQYDDAHAYCMYLFTEVEQWHIDPPKAATTPKEFDPKVAAAAFFKKHPEQLEAYIAALSTYRAEASIFSIAAE
ncbi:MAG TPA: hypothetical protein DD440_08010 [Porticoccaceae bacterium]|jgi:hypothetical protein|nr:hypothetical protein [Porticoccaceae bacterium]|tara:strand:- start:378 stop:869 length:492 start_codon:yes stop_codon:yes gene_type:complete